LTLKRALVTGAAGFVGSHLLRHLLTHTDWTIIAPVTFRHRGNPDRITSAWDDHPEWAQRVDVINWDLTAPASCTQLARIGHIDYLLNVASDSHVDRSISDPVPFIMNNTAVILNVLELARVLQPEIFLQMSTDEVYGPAPDEYSSREWDVIAPSNPYSASKAAQEAIAFSYWRSYGVPLVVTNTMNIIGEMQDGEKMIPKIIRSLIRDEPMTVHADANGVPGSRFYLHARNLADAWLWLLQEEGHSWDLAQYADGSTRPQRFNIVGEREVNNLDLVNIIGDIMGVVPRVKFVDFHGARPGHDRRYALDGTKLGSIGWRPPVGLEESLRKTVEWSVAHPEWVFCGEDVHQVPG
jgi:dTDP-glucose 4,6-dehydratase